MHIRISRTLVIVGAFSLLIYFVTCCGCSRGNGLSLKDIPRYPNATKKESKEKSFSGMLSTEFELYTTDDSYDKVLKFYTNELKNYETYANSNTDNSIEQRRQTVIMIKLKNGTITVLIEEFAEEGKVNITLISGKLSGPFG